MGKTFENSHELLKFMKIGWNLGNTMDAIPNETAWHNPVTTKEMIDVVKDAGFNLLRVPVSWGSHTSPAPDYTIDKEWLDRVEEIVNYGLDNDMAVIINIHHDNHIVRLIGEETENSKVYVRSIWTQLCERFKDYDERLVFECLNEPRVIRVPWEWHPDVRTDEGKEAFATLNELNQIFVDVVRSSGGNNLNRYIMVSPYAANPFHATFKEFAFPSDPSERLILSAHAYTPYNLALNHQSDVKKFTQKDEAELNKLFSRLNEHYCSKGIDVILGEMGILNKENPEVRREWSRFYVAGAKKYGMVSVWWDNHADRSFGLLNRRELKFHDSAKYVLEGLFEGLKD